MGWYGSFELKYKGQDKDKFVKLAKLIIPNYSERFEESDGVLECTRSLSWYSAEIDVEEIMFHLNNGDEIEMNIDGETHPIVSKKEAVEKGLSYKYLEDDYYDYDEDEEEQEGMSDPVDDFGSDEDIEVELNEEKVVFKKDNGNVEIINEFPDDQRYNYGNLGLIDDFIWMNQYNKTDDLQKYLQTWAEILADDIQMQKIACDFFAKVKKSMDKISNETIKEFFEATREPTSFMKYLQPYMKQIDGVVEKEFSEEAQRLLDQLTKNQINQLGGAKFLAKSVESKGYNEVANLLSMFGYNVQTDNVKIDDWFNER